MSESEVHPEAMLPLCLLMSAAFVQAPFVPAPAAPLPAAFQVPEGLRIKTESLAFQGFDQEHFDVRGTLAQGPLRVPVEGRVWRFNLESSGPRVGAIRLMQMLRPHLESTGWVWQWAERGVARRPVEGQDLWLRVASGASGELKVVLAEPGPPPVLVLQKPGTGVEFPKPDGDFSYLAPWPGARLVSSAPSQAPVAVMMPDGRAGFALVNFIEKEYALPERISAHAFLTVYRRALEVAGWDIEGNFKGVMIQLQATYQKDGRDLRATLRLVEDAMAISVADVGAQRPR